MDQQLRATQTQIESYDAEVKRLEEQLQLAQQRIRTLNQQLRHEVPCLFCFVCLLYKYVLAYFVQCLNYYICVFCDPAMTIGFAVL